MDPLRWLGWPFRHGQQAPEPEVVPDDPPEPRVRFQGEFTPQNLAFDSNLQEFARQVAYICGLESAGKITPNDAHARIRDLYEELARTYKGLGIGEPEG